MTPPPRREAKYTPDQIRDISVAVYKIRLNQDTSPNDDNVRRMLEKDAAVDPDDNGKKLRRRASSYDPLTRAYLDVLAGQVIK